MAFNPKSMSLNLSSMTKAQDSTTALKTSSIHRFSTGVIADSILESVIGGYDEEHQALHKPRFQT